MQNLYPASWLYLTSHCYVRSMFVKHNFVDVVVQLLFTVYYYHYYLLFLSIYFIIIIIIFNWYKLDCNFFTELCKIFPIPSKVLIIIIVYSLFQSSQFILSPFYPFPKCFFNILYSPVIVLFNADFLIRIVLVQIYTS